jgi:hypothetical protein
MGIIDPSETQHAALQLTCWIASIDVWGRGHQSLSGLGMSDSAWTIDPVLLRADDLAASTFDGGPDEDFDGEFRVLSRGLANFRDGRGRPLGFPDRPCPNLLIAMFVPGCPGQMPLPAAAEIVIRAEVLRQIRLNID